MTIDWGNMDEREIMIANGIEMHMIGIHFSPSVAKHLIKMLIVHTWPPVLEVEFKETETEKGEQK